MSDETINEILDEWFGPLDENGGVEASRRQRWFKKDPSFDEHIRSHYEAHLRRALEGEYDTWLSTPRGSLAFIILLDQFSRNMFRGSGEMYCGDQRAAETTLRSIEEGFDRTLRPVERQFLYMPLMHAEDLGMQDRCVEVFEALAREGIDVVDYARQHRDIVQRFGRFPHRNELLGRESTPEEREFLQQPGSSF